MCRHVIGAFAIVPERWITVGHEGGGELFEVVADGWIGVLANDQGGARVVDEHVAQAPTTP